MVGDADCGKTFLLKGLRQVYNCYERPDGGTYQLEDLLGKEVVFLNDFEYDVGAKDWMPWSYFKNFLEGGHVKVARAKNRGGNVVFKDNAPVFLTAPDEVKLFRRGQEDRKETVQMRKRIMYMHLGQQIPEENLQEVLHHCGHCSAQLYLEGNGHRPLPAGRNRALSNTAAAPAVPPQVEMLAEPPQKRRRTVQECVQELKELKELLDQGLLEQAEFADLKGRLLNGE